MILSEQAAKIEVGITTKPEKIYKKKYSGTSFEL